MSEELAVIKPVELMRVATDVAGACKAIVTKTAVDIQGRKYVRVEGWQSIATAHGCMLSATGVKRVADGPAGIVATGEVRRMSDGAILATAEGFVGDEEKTWGNREEYAKRGMAQTRAMSRAARSAFAHVVVMMDAGLETTPAEEVPHEGFEQAKNVTPAKPTQPRPPQTQETASTGQSGDLEIIESTIKSVDVADNKNFDSTKPARGKNWHQKWGIQFDDDPQGRTFGTFDRNTGQGAASYMDRGIKVKASVKANGKYWNVEALESADELPWDEVAKEGLDQLPPE